LPYNKLSRERRRATHKPVALVCGEMFTPRRNDANTCSSKCRQKLYREARRPALHGREQIG